MKILDRLNPDNTVSFNRPLAHALGLNAALVYSALIAKQEYYARRNMLDSEGCFFSTAADLMESTTLTRRQQSDAIATLINAGLIEYRVSGMPARRYFRVIDDEKLLDGFLAQGEEVLNSLNPSFQQRDENVTSCGNKTAPQELTKCENRFLQNVKVI